MSPLPTIHPSTPTILTPEPLTSSSFSAFGTLITSPLPSTLTSYPPQIPSALYPAYQPQPVLANQATALKTAPVGPLRNNYEAAVGGKGVGLMSIFSSFPRRNVYLGRSGSGKGGEGKLTPKLKLGILERHPFTTQTFCPFNYSDAHQPSTSTTSNPTPKTYILIIVAPTLPSPSSDPPNPPDLSRIRAFIHPLNTNDTPNVAVTYNAGTWHAPMIVLGDRRVDFLVTQFANGVAEDDCQEVLVGTGPDEAVLSGRVRAKRRGKRGGDGGAGGTGDVEVELGGWGIEVEGEDGDGGETDGKWTTDEMVLRAVRASKL